MVHEKNQRLLLEWTEPSPPNGPLEHYVVSVNWTHHGKMHNFADFAVEQLYTWPIPCENDGEYPVSITLSAVNCDPSSSQTYTTETLSHLVDVCHDPGQNNHKSQLMIAVCNLFISRRPGCYKTKCVGLTHLMHCRALPVLEASGTSPCTLCVDHIRLHLGLFKVSIVNTNNGIVINVACNVILFGISIYHAEKYVQDGTSGVRFGSAVQKLSILSMRWHH